MKDGMSGFDIAAMVAELQDLIGARIEKVYQPRRDQFLLRIKVPQSGKKDLVIVLGKWIYLASKAQETPKQPSSFAMLLRKHLSNGTITKIVQHGFDRIVVLHVQKAEEFQLVFEMFREGNVVLVSEGKIIQPLIPKTWSHREVRAHREYAFPPARPDPRELDIKGLSEILVSSKKNLVRTLATDVNLGGLYAEEACLLAGIEKGRKTDGLNEAELQGIHESIGQLFGSLSQARGGLIIKMDEQIVDIVPFQLKGYEGHTTETSETFSSALETYQGEEKELEPEDRSFLEKRARIERQLVQQEQAVLNLEERAEQHKRRAESIYAHYQVCENILNTIKTSLKKKDINDVIASLKEFSEFNALAPEKKEVSIILSDEDGNQSEIILAYEKPLEENAGIYYDKVKKAKEKLEGAKKSIVDTKKKLDRVQVENEEDRRKKKKQTKQFWFEKYKWFISSDGNIVIAGRDAKSNDRIVKKYLSDKDRYAHADIHGAPSVVIKSQEEEISEQTLKEACEFALVHSKAWNAKIGAGSAYWVKPDQVSKTPPAGEFLPRGAFMIYGRKNMQANIEFRMAVGLIEYENIEKVMCGPPSAIKTHCSRYIEFGPGEMKKNSFTKRLMRILDSEEEAVARVLPPGDIRIIATTGFPEDVFK
jgi:predicted ribosome quality control (RQC) complex YloA/Tae2 family protein